MKQIAMLMAAVIFFALSLSSAQANSLCKNKEGFWIVPPKQEKAFGNKYLGGFCDDNACYHIAISNDAKGEDLSLLAFTCEEPGDGTDKILWVMVDVATGEKQEMHANSKEINNALLQVTNQAGWTSACNGQIPLGAEPQGYEASGEKLWAARAQLSDPSDGKILGIAPGKVRPGLKGANVPYGGQEVGAQCYEVWVGPAHWVEAKGGNLPQCAAVVGQEASGESLFLARGMYKGGLHIGKIRPGLGAALIPYGGKEVPLAQYEVMCP